MKNLIYSILLILFVTGYSLANQSGEFSYKENKEFWQSVDRINNKFDKLVKLELLENIFEEALNILSMPDFINEFENLRKEAFDLNDFSRIDSFVNRSKPVFNVEILGEANSFGINIDSFIKKCPDNTSIISFYLLAKEGFYTKVNDPYSLVVSKMPAWFKRTESSYQGLFIKEAAKEYLKRWQLLLPRLKGIYKNVGQATISNLKAEILKN